MRFTFRQREFARLYAQGLPAAQAARAAGYAASTAETNAARLLGHPGIAASIQRQRHTRRIVTRQDVELCVERLREIIRTDQDPDRIIRATRQMARFLHGQQQDGVSLAEEPEQKLDGSDNPNDNSEAQGIDLQPEAKPGFCIDDTDKLPSGQAAFDLRVAPVRPEITREPDPVIVRFVVDGKEKPLYPGPDGT